MPQSRVRFIGSRELHRDLPKVLDALEDPSARYVLTIHSRPKAVMIGAEAFLELVRGVAQTDRLLALQLAALVQGLSTWLGGITAQTPLVLGLLLILMVLLFPNGLVPLVGSAWRRLVERRAAHPSLGKVPTHFSMAWTRPSSFGEVRRPEGE